MSTSLNTEISNWQDQWKAAKENPRVLLPNRENATKGFFEKRGTLYRFFTANPTSKEAIKRRGRSVERNGTPILKKIKDVFCKFFELKLPVTQYKSDVDEKAIVDRASNDLKQEKGSLSPAQKRFFQDLSAKDAHKRKALDLNDEGELVLTDQADVEYDLQKIERIEAKLKEYKDEAYGKDSTGLDLDEIDKNLGILEWGLSLKYNSLCVEEGFAFFQQLSSTLSEEEGLAFFQQLSSTLKQSTDGQKPSPKLPAPVVCLQELSLDKAWWDKELDLNDEGELVLAHFRKVEYDFQKIEKIRARFEDFKRKNKDSKDEHFVTNCSQLELLLNYRYHQLCAGEAKSFFKTLSTIDAMDGKTLDVKDGKLVIVEQGTVKHDEAKVEEIKRLLSEYTKHVNLNGEEMNKENIAGNLILFSDQLDNPFDSNDLIELKKALGFK